MVKLMVSNPSHWKPLGTNQSNHIFEIMQQEKKQREVASNSIHNRKLKRKGKGGKRRSHGSRSSSKQRPQEKIICIIFIPFAHVKAIMIHYWGLLLTFGLRLIMRNQQLTVDSRLTFIINSFLHKTPVCILSKLSFSFSFSDSDFTFTFEFSSQLPLQLSQFTFSVDKVSEKKNYKVCQQNYILLTQWRNLEELGR